MLYRRLLRPLLFRLSQDPEDAHELALNALERLSQHPTACAALRTITARHETHLGKTVCGIRFPNPIGLAAGFAKKPIGLRGLQALGFGFIELGTITANQQDGNPRPRIFRLEEDQALINRMGFPNLGATKTAELLEPIRDTVSIPLGINIGKSKDTPLEQADEDYLATFDQVNHFADYTVVNVSSPNTKDIRKLQGKEALKSLLKALSRRRNERYKHHGDKHAPLFVKVAPDLNEAELEDVMDVVSELRLDGMIATNTTITRPNLRLNSTETGGLSGRPLRRMSFDMVKRIRRKLPLIGLIGVGGLDSVDDAYAMLTDAGADLCQIYTGLVYQGPSLPGRLVSGLAHRFYG